MLKVSLVILNWNGIDDTLECLTSAMKLNAEGLRLEIIVVDNGSTDNSLKELGKIKEITLIKNNENLGFSGGNNVGIKYALKNEADYIVVLNNDVTLEKNSIKELISQMASDSTIGASSPKIYFSKGYEYKKGRYKTSDLGRVIWYAGGVIDWANVYGQTNGVDKVDRGQFDEVYETDFATGTCMIVSREVIEKVGMFDERYYMYYEDTDLSQRIKKSGYKIVFNPKSIIWHKVAQGSGIGSTNNDYFISRNRMLFGMRYARLRTKLAIIKESLRLLFRGRSWQRIGVRDYYLGKLGKGSWK